jgi:hypothetical protein
VKLCPELLNCNEVELGDHAIDWLILLIVPEIVVGKRYFAASVPLRLRPERLIVLEPAFAESKTPVGVPATDTTSEFTTPLAIVGVPPSVTVVEPS